MALLVGAVAAKPAAAEFKFIAIGDLPYGKPEEVCSKFEALIGVINARQPAFTIHIGDVKSASTPCTDQILTDQLNFMNTFESALVYTPGDNEWTDCYRKNAGAFDPLDRLAFLRKTFFANPARSLGKQPIAVESQALVMAEKFAGFPENARFVKDGVHFVTAHVVGSNNNLEARDPKAVLEFFERNAANVAWLNASFDKAIAESAPTVVVAFQADVFEFDFNAVGDETFLRHSGYAEFATALVAKAKAFAKPVLIIYGDSHIFRVTRPFMKTAPNILALEVYGDQDMHAVEVNVDTGDPAIFGFRTVLNPAVKNAE